MLTPSKMTECLLTTALLTLLVVPNQSQALDAKRLFKEVRRSVVLVMSFDVNDQPLAIGSGFFVQQGSTIVTNYHVIEGANSVRVKQASGKVVPVTNVRGIDIDHDLVLLGTSSSGRPLRLATREPEIGEDIIAIGNPKGLEGTLSAGIISGIRREGGSIYYQVTASISPGSSGGPIIDEKGQVIGVSTFYVRGGQNLNFAMPAAYIQRLLRSERSIPLKAATKQRVRVPIKEVSEQVEVIETKIIVSNLEGSILNRTHYAIKNIRLVAIFYPRQWDWGDYSKKILFPTPIHHMLFTVQDVIPPGLAKRFRQWDKYIQLSWSTEIRVPDYDIIEGSSEGLGLPVFK